MLLFFFCTATAQDKTLKEVKVRHRKAERKTIADERINSFAPGMQTLTVDSVLMEQYALQSLSNLLSQQVPVFIKSYGINSLATLNFRGSSAAQSQLLWNGVPLNNASIGLADVSLLSVQQFDKIHILYGGSSALSGSGNVGAALMIDNNFSNPDTTKRLHSEIAVQAGSFNQYRFAIKEQYNSGKLFVGINASGQYAQNDFGYTDAGGVQEKMTNARLKSIATMLNGGYQFNKRLQLRMAAWYQDFDRQIPPALFERFSVKRQQDRAMRFFLELKHNKEERRILYAKAAFMQDEMEYTDTMAASRTRNQTRQLYTEYGWKKIYGLHHELLFFLPVNISRMRPDRDTQDRVQYKLAIAGAYAYRAFEGKLKLATNLRAERINDQSVLLPGFNTSYAIFPQLTLRANVQRSYRAPTLNEWYYNPGGNPSLKPEQGWSKDAGYALRLLFGQNIVLTHEAGVFDRTIRDWILWFGGSIWTPHNIAEVRSRGMETINSIQWRRQHWVLRVGANTSFVLATTKSSYIPGDGSIGKQIPFTPRYNGQVNISTGYKNVYLSYNHTYTGYRFITTDESQYLEPYQTGNLYCSFKKAGSVALTFAFHLNNLWNARYEVVNLRPMPGRNIACSIAFAF